MSPTVPSVCFRTVEIDINQLFLPFAFEQLRLISNTSEKS